MVTVLAGNDSMDGGSVSVLISVLTSVTVDAGWVTVVVSRSCVTVMAEGGSVFVTVVRTVDPGKVGVSPGRVIPLGCAETVTVWSAGLETVTDSASEAVTVCVAVLGTEETTG